jgi:hypothetical protein
MNKCDIRGRIFLAVTADSLANRLGCRYNREVVHVRLLFGERYQTIAPFSPFVGGISQSLFFPIEPA